MAVVKRVFSAGFMYILFIHSYASIEIAVVERVFRVGFIDVY